MSNSYSAFVCRLQGGSSACLGEERGRVGEREESQRKTDARGETVHSMPEADGQQISSHMLELWFSFIKPPSAVLFACILYMNDFVMFLIF